MHMLDGEEITVTDTNTARLSQTLTEAFTEAQHATYNVTLWSLHLPAVATHNNITIYF